MGVVNWVSANPQKFSPPKSTFKQFAKVFSREMYPLYGGKLASYLKYRCACVHILDSMYVELNELTAHDLISPHLFHSLCIDSVITHVS